MSHTHTMFMLLLAGIYMIPAIVAAFRKLPSANSIAVVNIFLGWTFIGWVVALAMAVAGTRRNAR